MSLPTKRSIELAAYFAVGLLIISWTHVGFYVYAGIITGVNILYVLMAKTILPTLKHTMPNFFGSFITLTTGQLVHCALLCCAAWAPVTLLIGGTF